MEKKIRERLIEAFATGILWVLYGLIMYLLICLLFWIFPVLPDWIILRCAIVIFVISFIIKFKFKIE